MSRAKKYKLKTPHHVHRTPSLLFRCVFYTVEYSYGDKFWMKQNPEDSARN
jgi:hypothetical protein